MKNFPRNSGQGLVGRLSRTSPVGCSSTSNEFLVPHRLSSSQAFLQSYRSLSRNQAPKSGPIFSTILAQMFLKKNKTPPKKKKRTIEFVELNPPKKKKKQLVENSTPIRALCTLCADKAAKQATCTVHRLRLTGVFPSRESHAIVVAESNHF